MRFSIRLMTVIWSSVMTCSSILVSGFGTETSTSSRSTTSTSLKYLNSKSILFSSSRSNDINGNSKTHVTSSSSSLVNGSASSKLSQKSLFDTFDQAGLRLKPMAISARDKAANVTYSEAPFKKLFFTGKACLLITMFLFYRSYRGLFVILPAIFRNVYDKLENSVAVDFLDEDKKGMDIDPETGKVRLRTRVVVSLLASVVTASYMISGATRVLSRFYKTINSTSDVERSFEAAADEVMRNEKTILGNLETKTSSGGASEGKIRGKLFS